MIKNYINKVKNNIFMFLYPDLSFTTLNLDIKTKRKRKRKLYKFNSCTQNKKYISVSNKNTVKIYKKHNYNEIIFSTNNLTFLN